MQRKNSKHTAQCQIGSLGLRPGKVAVIVPLVAPSVAGAVTAASACRGQADLVEWRLDLLAPREREQLWDTPRELLRRIDDLRCAAQTPVLATIRTQAEGGEWALAEAEYEEAVTALAVGADLVDVEKRHPNWRELTLQVQQAGAAAVVSQHDFAGTPTVAEMVEILREIQFGGADIAKLAVTPQKPVDVVDLLSATCATVAADRTPIITIAMGKLGTVTRVAGGVFGSCATFATIGGHSSAPGQLEVTQLRQVLELLAD